MCWGEEGTGNDFIKDDFTDGLFGKEGKAGGEYPKTDNQSKNMKNEQFYTFGDFLQNKLGPAWKSHPEEYNYIINDLEKKGIKIEYREGVYFYDGKKLVMDYNSSIGAWRHEYKHILDHFEMNRPKPGLLIRDPLMHWQYEQRGYMEELKLAREHNDIEAERAIMEELKLRLKQIMGLGDE